MSNWIKNRAVRRVLLILMDVCLLLAGAWIAMMLRFESQIPQDVLRHVALSMPWIAAIYVVTMYLGGMYRALWRYAGGREFVTLGVCFLCAGLVTLLINAFLPSRLPNSVLALTCAYGFGFVTISRYAWKMIRLYHHDLEQKQASTEKNPEPIRILIVGAGSAGSWVVTQCREQRIGQPVALVDDAPVKRNMRIQGVPVLGNLKDIARIVTEKQIQEIIIAIPSLKGSKLEEIATVCTGTKCIVRVLSGLQGVDEGGNATKPVIRQLNTADFLSRDEVKLDTERIREYLTDKTVLVTGGGGSIGSEICRQVMRFSPKQLIIFDIYENCAYELYYEMRQKYGAKVPIVVLVGSVRDKARLDDVMETYHPDVVFHAAAHKHVPLMEVSPAEAIKNNVIGTRNVLLSASEHGVERFVILSTDKAVNPTNVMGATKRITEMIVQTLGPKTNMKCMAVRFGNVLGSHGSVIPLFEEQIKHGGPVTITDPEITRYFMTIPEAAQLVLQAGSLAQDSAIYVLDMGKPVKIMDLAKRLIRFYGYEPGVDIQIVVTGLRPGEKLYEELLMDEEASRMVKTEHNQIFVASPIQLDEKVFLRQLDELQALCEQNAAEAVVDKLAETVQTFHPQRQKLVG